MFAGWFALFCAHLEAAQCQPVEIAKLISPGSTSQESFGYSSAISGDTLVVGDPSDAEKGPGAGAVYVFRRSGGTPQEWRWTAKLHASDTSAGQNFGGFVAVNDNTIAVGSPLDSSLGIQDAGAVYVFERADPSSDTWVQNAKLTASDPYFAALFGAVAVIDGETLAVGAPLAQPRDLRTGAVYVFEKQASATGARWVQMQRLFPPKGKDFLWFGSTLALSEVVLATGAPSDDAGILQGGAVYVYERRSKRWQLEATLTTPDIAVNDGLATVVLSDNQLIAGAVADDDQGPSSGSAYVFTKNDGEWQFTQKLLPIQGRGGDNFSASLAAEGDLLIATARNSSAQATDAGVAYAFHRGADGMWSPAGALNPSELQPQDIMQNVSLSDGIAVLGIITFPVGGTVHVFDTRLERTVTTYCEPSPASWPDCLPAIETSGNATASGTSAFLVRAGPLPAGLVGFFVYTHSPSMLPIGDVAVTCLPGPALGRSQLLFTDGTFGNCDGQLELDWNDLLATQAGLDPSLAEPGTHVYGQFAYFAWGASGRAGFTDAVAFVTCP